MSTFQARRSLGTIAAMFVTACSGSPSPARSDRERPKPADARTVAVIDLRPLTISFRGVVIARLFADGRTESAGPNAPVKDMPLIPGPTLHADGTIVMTRGGTTARIDHAGEIYVMGRLFGSIEGDQLTLAGSSKWNVRVRENVIEFGEQNSSIIDGEVTPSMRHTALVMAAAFYIDGAIASP